MTGLAAVPAILSQHDKALFLLVTYGGLIAISIAAAGVQMFRKKRRREPTVEEVEALARKHGLI